MPAHAPEPPFRVRRSTDPKHPVHRKPWQKLIIQKIQNAWPLNLIAMGDIS